MFRIVARRASEDLEQIELINEEKLRDIRCAAEVHRTVRRHMRTNVIKPGIPMVEMCETLENLVRQLIQEKGLEAGIAFPTGCSLNRVAAHWTPNSGDKTVLQYDDVMKLGTHVLFSL